VYFGPKGAVCVLNLPTPPSSRLGSSFSRRAPAAANPKVYAEHHVARAVTYREYHIGSLQELPYMVCDPVGPLLFAFYDPQ
jgi:hypothetical protein